MCVSARPAPRMLMVAAGALSLCWVVQCIGAEDPHASPLFLGDLQAGSELPKATRPISRGAESKAGRPQRLQSTPVTPGPGPSSPGAPLGLLALPGAASVTQA